MQRAALGSAISRWGSCASAQPVLGVALQPDAARPRLATPSPLGGGVAGSILRNGAARSTNDLSAVGLPGCLRLGEPLRRRSRR